MPRVQPNRRRAIADPELELKIEEFSRGASTAPEQPESSSPAPTPSEVKSPTQRSAATAGFNFKMTPEDHQRLKALCAKEERSIQWCRRTSALHTDTPMVGPAPKRRTNRFLDSRQCGRLGWRHPVDACPSPFIDEYTPAPALFGAYLLAGLMAAVLTGFAGRRVASGAGQ